MEPSLPLPPKSLREHVYDHLKGELKRGGLDTGAFLDLEQLARTLGVSRTPLRDALLQLEAEEFVTIVARRGVAVRSLEPRDIREIYQLVGALEGSALAAVAPGLSPADLAHLGELDARAQAAVEAGAFEAFSEANYAFHDFFLERNGNARITRLVHQKKQQLYDWNRRAQRLNPSWERSGLREHEEILRLLAAGAFGEAAAYLRDIHWGYPVQEGFVNEVYFADPD